MTSKHIYFFFIAILILFSCSPTRRLKDHQFLHTKNTVKETRKLPANERDELAEYVVPATNKKILGFWRIYLQIYNLPNEDKINQNKIKQYEKINDKNIKIADYNSKQTNPNKKRKYKEPKLLFGEWLQSIGEAPVLFDSIKIKKSKDLLRRYAINKGFFRTTVIDSVIYNKKKKMAQVIYTVNRGPAYYVDSISYNVNDFQIANFIEEMKGDLKKGMKYDLEIFDEERDKITELLRNNGYYLFVKDYLKYEADTISDSLKVQLSMKLNDPNLIFLQRGDTVKVTKHKRFRINEIYVIPNYQIDKSLITSVDTVRYRDYTYIYYNKQNYNPKILSQSIFFERGEFFQATDEVRTHKALSELKNFKYINVRFEPIFTNEGTDKLNCYIELSPTPKQAIGLEAQGTNTDGNLGISLSTSYINKNIFKGAELLEFRLYGGAEIQIIQGDSADIANSNVLGPFNTFEVGTQISLLMNRFLFPIKISKIKKFVRPKSRLTLNFNYQTRPDYQRWVGSILFGYEWNSSAKIKHVLNPAEISLIKIDPEQQFTDFINSINDQFVRNSFRDHYIQAGSYTFLFNSQDITKRKNFIFFRGNLQWAGNILYAISKITNDPLVNGKHTVLGNIAYAQFFRSEFDFRMYNYLHKNHSLAFRAFLGIGVPYGNSDVMPFEKAFFIGGSNDLRAWLPRTMGPGSFNGVVSASDTGRVDQVGDIKILVNAEYRLKMWRFIEGALFADFGNIWLMRQDANRPNGEFAFDRFWNEFAFGAGAGLRFNFGFFIFRLDVALPIRDPRLPSGERWVITKLQFKDVRFNVAIGYPF